MQTNADITLWNKYVDPDTRTEAYQRVEITAVHWESVKAAQKNATGGSVSADKATVYVTQFGRMDYRTPRAWVNMSDKGGYWTLQEGDVIAKGLLQVELSGAYTLSNLKADYDDVLVITSVDNMDSGLSGMRHWQVGAK
jgi:hypothetical protein